MQSRIRIGIKTRCRSTTQLEKPNYIIGSVADPDPGSGAFLPPWIRDPELGKKKNEWMDEQPGSNISESLETIFFWVKILTFFYADPH
jgi:hypothetical protein